MLNNAAAETLLWLRVAPLSVVDHGLPPPFAHKNKMEVKLHYIYRHVLNAPAPRGQSIQYLGLPVAGPEVELHSPHGGKLEMPRWTTSLRVGWLGGWCWSSGHPTLRTNFLWIVLWSDVRLLQIRVIDLHGFSESSCLEPALKLSKARNFRARLLHQWKASTSLKDVKDEISNSTSPWSWSTVLIKIVSSPRFDSLSRHQVSQL